MSPIIYRSQYPDVEVTDSDLVEFVFSNPNKIPDSKPLYIDAVTGTTRTYGDVKQRTRSLARGLRDRGVKPRDVVALFSPNSIDYAITCFAIIGCGATVSPVSAAYTPTELLAQLTTSGAKLLIVHSTLLSTAQKAIKASPGIKLMIADGDSSGESAERLATQCPADRLVTIPPSEASTRLAFMCFSSGTTGRAKGVMTTHRNVVSNLQQWAAHLPTEQTPASTLVQFLPLSHIYGLALSVTQAVYVGATTVLLARFDPQLYLASVARYRPEVLWVVPPVMLLLAKSPLVARYDLSSVRRLRSAAAPLSPELRQAVEARFAALYGTTVLGLQSWGMTETSPLATTVPNHYAHRRDTVGNIAPNMQFRVVDPVTLRDVPAAAGGGSSGAGELWCRGPNVTPGYYGNAAATAEGFARERDGVTWYRTGDVGLVSADGFVTLVDRIKEMIKYKGTQVIPSELEGKLLEHAEVADACVVGQWVEDMATELPVGFIVLAPAAKTEAEAGRRADVVERINAWLNERVANHKKLRGGIYLVDTIPKSTSGKILRRELKDWLKSRESKTASKL